MACIFGVFSCYRGGLVFLLGIKVYCIIITIITSLIFGTTR